MGVFWRVAATLLLLLLAAAMPARAEDDGADAGKMPGAPLNEQVLNIPGDSAIPVTLEVTVFTPPGPGPFPLAVMNHGATNASPNNRGARYRFTYSAFYFLSRGYAVALPMMRGFAGSGGAIVHRGCDLADVAVTNARDIRAVISYMTTRPYVDASRVVVAGQSFGGWNALGLGTLDHVAVRGLVNFVGGARMSDCTAQDASLIAAAGYLGAHTSLPSIWFYGDNDKVFGPATWRAMYERYTKAGGHAELVPIGNFLNDAHELLSFPESIPIWTPKVDRFLLGIGLPGTPVFPQYMPRPLPPPTHFAAIDDIAAIPGISERGHELYRQFLTRPFPRVFLIAANGGVATYNGGFDPLARALKACGAVACWPYAVDDYVVWVKRDATAAARADEPPLVRRTVAAGATATIDFSYSVNPDCSLRGLSKLVLDQQPEHGVARIGQRSDFPHFPPNSQFAACNSVRVPGATLDYTPARGFTGSDFLAFEVVDLDGRHHSYRVAMTVQ